MNRDKSWLIIVGFLKFLLKASGGFCGTDATLMWYFTAEVNTQEWLLQCLFWEDRLLLKRQFRASGKSRNSGGGRGKELLPFLLAGRAKGNKNFLLCSNK